MGEYRNFGRTGQRAQPAPLDSRCSRGGGGRFSSGGSRKSTARAKKPKAAKKRRKLPGAGKVAGCRNFGRKRERLSAVRRPNRRRHCCQKVTAIRNIYKMPHTKKTGRPRLCCVVFTAPFKLRYRFCLHGRAAFLILCRRQPNKTARSESACADPPAERAVVLSFGIGPCTFAPPGRFSRGRLTQTMPRRGWGSRRNGPISAENS